VRDSLLRVIRIDPLFPNVQKGEMVATGFLEILMSLVGVHLLVFRSVKHGVRFLQHGDDRQDLSDEEKFKEHIEVVSRRFPLKSPLICTRPDTHLVGTLESFALDDRL